MAGACLSSVLLLTLFRETCIQRPGPVDYVTVRVCTTFAYLSARGSNKNSGAEIF